MGNETESVAKFCTHTLCTTTLTVMPQLTSKPDIPITYFATCVFHTRLSKYIQHIYSFTKYMLNYVFHTILSKYLQYTQSTNMVNYFLRKNTCIQGLHKITGGILKGYEFLENVLWKYRNIYDKNDPSRTISPHCVKCLDPDKWSVQIPIQGHFSAQNCVTLFKEVKYWVLFFWQSKLLRKKLNISFSAKSRQVIFKFK